MFDNVTQQDAQPVAELPGPKYEYQDECGPSTGTIDVSAVSGTEIRNLNLVIPR